MEFIKYTRWSADYLKMVVNNSDAHNSHLQFIKK